MRKIFLLLTCIVSAAALFAQEPADALRFSWYTSSGTARQQAVGGAMASLGGDLTAAYINPAGLGFYKTGDFVLTPGFNFLNNKSTYYGRTEKDKKNNFSFGTSGIVIGSRTDPDRKGKTGSSSFAIAINRTANFGSNLLYRGVNNQSSYSQKFLEELKQDNITTDAAATNYPFGTSLAINTYWIDTADGWTAGNKTFKSLATPLLQTGGLLQEQQVINKGGISELALAFAGSQKDKFFFGFTLGIPFLNYSKESTFSEADPSSDNTNRFDFASITENLTTKGTGLNLKLGVIYKPVEYLRLGLAIHTPTFYRLIDKYNTSVTTNTELFKGTLTQQSSGFTDGQDGQFSYWLFTPYRIMASASYVLREVEDVRKQKGFITADIEYINYKASSYTTDPEGDDSQESNDYLKSLNKAIDNTYKSALNFKVGGELKFTTIMARLGAAYYGNPYKDVAGAKGNRFLLSGGLGYRNKGMFIDLTYVHNMTKDVHYAYRLQNAPFSAANIKSTAGNAILTVGFKI
ncbi:MAG: aromatic hydrocarbon degradation protein [Chitinophagaceae bacterium]